MAGKKADVELIISAKNETEKTMVELLATIKKLSESSGDLENKQKELTAAFAAADRIEKSLLKAANDRNRSLQQQQSAIEKTKAALATLNEKYEELKTKTEGARKPSDRLVNTLANQQKRQQELADAIRDTTNQLNQSKSTLSAGGVDPKATKALDNERKKVNDLAQAWRETTEAIEKARQVLAQKETAKVSADTGQAEARANLDALRKQLKAARELASVRNKEVAEASEASQEQVAARDKATDAVRRLKAAVEAQAKVERELRKERSVATNDYTKQAALIDRLVTKGEKQRVTYEALKDSLTQFEQVQNKLSTDRQSANVDRLTNELAELQKQYQTVSDRIAASQSKLATATGPSPQSIAGLAALKQKIQETETELNQQTAALQATSKQMDAAGLSAEKLKNDQVALVNASKSLGDIQKRLSNETGKTREQFRLWGEGSRQTLSFLQRIRGEMLSVIASFTGLYAAGEGIRGVYDSTVALEKATARLSAKFNGDFSKIGGEIDFVRKESERLGIEFKTLLDQYTRFVNSVPEGTLNLDQVKYTFIGVAEAGRVAGLSTDDFNGVFTALSQIASKGTVALEELRGQIAERIPSAVELMSKGLTDVSGKLITTGELMERISKGELDASSIVAFAKALKDQFGPGLELATNSSVAQMARFKNAVTDIQLEFAKAGFIDELTKSLKLLVAELKTKEVQSAIKAIAENISGLVRQLKDVIIYLDVFVKLIIGIVSFRAGLYFTRFAASVFSVSSSFRKGLPGLVAYDSATKALVVSLKSLVNSLLLLPGVFLTAKGSAELFFDFFPNAEKFMRKVFLSIFFGFENLAITVREKTDLMTTYFSRGWVNVIRDIAKFVTDFIPYVFGAMIRNVADKMEVLSSTIADQLRKVATEVEQSNDNLVDYFHDMVAPDVDVSAQMDKIRKEAEQARRDVADEMDLMFQDIDNEGKVKIITPEQVKDEGKQYGQEFVDSEIEFFKAGSKAGKEIGDGLLTELQKIERSLQEETADTLEERLKLIETEFTEFLKKLDSFNAGASEEITKIQTDAEKQIEAIRANAGMKEEARAKAIASIELQTATAVSEIRSNQGQLGNARSLVKQLIEVRKEKEKQEYYDDKVKEAETKVNDLLSKRKEEQEKINELVDLNLITTEEQATRLRALNEQAFVDIRKAVDEARVLAETTGNASLKEFVADFDGFENLERRRQLVSELEDQEQRINDELSLRQTKLDTLNTLRENGVISTAVAEEESRKVLDESNLVLGEMVDKAIALAQNLGDEQMIARLEAVKAGLVGLNTQVFSGAQLSEDFASGFTGAFRAFVEGTQTASDAFRSFVSSFLANIAEAILQAVILKAITGSFAGGSGGIGGAIAGGLNTLFNHDGGIVGVDGYRKMVNPLVFAGALRYHSGGIAGLKPNEVPTILQRGEEVLTANDPRHRNNQGSSGQQIGVKIVNSIDSGSVVSEGLSTSSGQKAIINVIRANKSSIKSLLV